MIQYIFEKSNQLTIEIYDSAFFLVANNQIGFLSQIKILSPWKNQ